MAVQEYSAKIGACERQACCGCTNGLKHALLFQRAKVYSRLNQVAKAVTDYQRALHFAGSSQKKQAVRRRLTALGVRPLG